MENGENRRHAGMFKPGQSGNPAGRPKGLPNKFSTLKAQFLRVFEEIGGKEELARWVKEHPRNQEIFYRLIVQMMPREDALRVDTESNLVHVLATINETSEWLESIVREEEEKNESQKLLAPPGDLE